MQQRELESGASLHSRYLPAENKICGCGSRPVHATRALFVSVCKQPWITQLTMYTNSIGCGQKKHLRERGALSSVTRRHVLVENDRKWQRSRICVCHSGDDVKSENLKTIPIFPLGLFLRLRCMLSLRHRARSPVY